MDKGLHIRLLDVLQQNNAVDAMFDVKPFFLDELDTQDKRKHFKSQVDYLLNQGYIETNGRFDYLTWELLDGLYPIDNKRIEARLVGNWDIYFSKKRGGGITKPEPAAAATPPPPTKKVSLYDAPASVLPYPGVSLKDKAPAPPPAAADDTIFKSRTPAPTPIAAHASNNDEDDFEPFKTKNPQPPKAATPAPQPPPKPEAPGIIEFSPNKAATYTPPKDAGTMASIKDEYVPRKPSYIPPKTEPATPPQILTYTPPKPGDTPAPTPAEAVPPRIQARPSQLKKEQEEEEPVFTSRLPKQFKNAPPVPPPTPKPEPKPEPQPQYQAPIPPPAPAPQVVNLRTPPPAATMPDVPPAPVNPMVPQYQQVPYQQPQYQPQMQSAPPSAPGGHYSSIQFDTENNPFNALGMIDLSQDTKDLPKKNNFITILKWTAFVIILLVVIAAVVLYKKRYR
jgi:hypothetical protein